MEPTPGTLDPRQAATLLATTNRQARRRLEPYPPWLTATRAFLVLAGSGAIWLQVRGQHPYRGPSVDLAVPVVLAFVAVNFGLTIAVARHAAAGVSGRSRLHPAEIAVMAVAWVGVYTAMGVLAGTGASRAFVYGLYPTTVPLIVVGFAWASIMAARANWRRAGTGVAIALIGAAGLLAGPAGAWAVAGGGVCVVLLAIAATRAWQQRGELVQAVTNELDPLIHVPTRLKIMATLAALPDGDRLSFTRLQDMLSLTPGNLTIQLHKLEDAGYLDTEKSRNGATQLTTAALTDQGRKALRAYTQALRDLLGEI